MNPEPSDLERVGGDAVVVRAMERFVRDMAADFVIGFLFDGRDLGRIARHEAELGIRMLGGDAVYTGRGLVSLHRALKLQRGQFRRRLFVLRRALAAEGVPEDLVERWVQHHEAMEAAIVGPGDCGPPEVAGEGTPEGTDSVRRSD